ncbi:hypothetical protein, partial [Streptococcus suis]|uniref:hypothetical protein n=1 Tax=Streptococcus suis TaxID=1307 RepID=UPI001C993BBA
EMENEQLLIGIARFFICERLVFAQPHYVEVIKEKLNDDTRLLGIYPHPYYKNIDRNYCFCTNSAV